MASLPREKNKGSNMDEIEVVLRRFGDEQSNLLDQFERLSFEVQLKQAILRRSLSEPTVARSTFQAPPPSPLPVLPLVTTEVRQGRRGSGFGKVFKKLLKPILGRKGKKNSKNGGRNEIPDPKNPKYCKAFSRSLRF
ncbi:Leukocyte immunoglobulin-like receptor subfamily A member [Melia azedarach]|uniref:Leukocyte immunoglobulin-like receptor subfamily A member n=1 Tax=Melia azedarach TaxID=155640 RepID=A0ACC1X009_MELAZ|nr:Leukocyte immunoglobulin-like receptor subfamily A member [Melia azedarach]